MAAFDGDHPNYCDADQYRVKIDDEWVGGGYCLLEALQMYANAKKMGLFAEVVAVFEDGPLRLWGIPWGWLDQWAGVQRWPTSSPSTAWDGCPPRTSRPPSPCSAAWRRGEGERCGGSCRTGPSWWPASKTRESERLETEKASRTKEQPEASE